MISVNGYPGLYVVYDGIVGCGKTAQFGRLKRVLPKDFPGVDITFTYEPGGNPEADKIRQKAKHWQVGTEEEIGLFADARAISIPQIVRPALKRGGLVFSDRSFTTSLDYQGVGREYGIREVWRINEPIVKNTFPDVLVLPWVGFEVSLNRSAGDNPDKFDGKREFLRRCYDGYTQVIEFLQEISPNTRVIKIDDPDGALNIEEIGRRIEGELYPMIDGWIREGRIIRERQI